MRLVSAILPTPKCMQIPLERSGALWVPSRRGMLGVRWGWTAGSEDRHSGDVFVGRQFGQEIPASFASFKSTSSTTGGSRVGHSLTGENRCVSRLPYG
jgi:hypothetical protein